ncbi:hypothetical protein L3V77_17320 [Vibrio sp. DW001]|uniref:hypothetical protein n=1 Tax=Vibrio TaxID=662 RepID=UPI000C81B07E|nr:MULTISPECIES: hypothetical protein [Vibrio]PMM05698.1 hypothetical protein BCT63_09150 [Vibrio kanaloae]WED29194.1 hypothetical protein L3V77_17320 [Vibrio sp. DW001]
MNTISKEKYIELLEEQRQHLEKKVEAVKDDLFTLETAIEDLDARDFNEVEVTEKDGTFTFNIVEKNND